jgi:hypothetical protein
LYSHSVVSQHFIEPEGSLPRSQEHSMVHAQCNSDFKFRQINTAKDCKIILYFRQYICWKISGSVGLDNPGLFTCEFLRWLSYNVIVSVHTFLFCSDTFVTVWPTRGRVLRVRSEVVARESLSVEVVLTVTARTATSNAQNVFVDMLSGEWRVASGEHCVCGTESEHPRPNVYYIDVCLM